MQVGFNFFQPRNNFFSSGAINNNIAKANAANGKTQNAQRRDKVNLSPQGKMMKTIENLINQKKTISEQRGELIGRTLEDGKELKTIEYQLEAFEDQLNEIDKQIKQLTTEMAKSVTEPEDKKKKSKKTDEEKTEEQARTEHLSNIASTADSIKNAETVSAVKKKVEGEAKVKESEIKKGEIFIDYIESKAGFGENVKDMVASLRGINDSKVDEVLELEQQIEALGSSQAVKLGSVDDELKESSKDVVNSGDKQPDESEQETDS